MWIIDCQSWRVCMCVCLRDAGSGRSVMRLVFASSYFFMSEPLFKNHCLCWSNRLTSCTTCLLFVVAASGACGAIAHDALMNPFDVIKQRMQVHGSVYRSILECASKVYHAEGLRAFYISYPTTLSITIPCQAIQVTTYEYLRKVLNPSGQYDPMTHVMAGGVAGAVAAAATTPLDVAKTLLQTRGESKDIRIRNCNGLFEAARLIYQRQGLAGFAKGLQPRVLSHMPSTAICWSVYEYGKFFMRRESLDKQPIMT